MKETLCCDRSGPRAKLGYMDLVMLALRNADDFTLSTREICDWIVARFGIDPIKLENAVPGILKTNQMANGRPGLWKKIGKFEGRCKTRSRRIRWQLADHMVCEHFPTPSKDHGRGAESAETAEKEQGQARNSSQPGASASSVLPLEKMPVENPRPASLVTWQLICSLWVSRESEGHDNRHEDAPPSSQPVAPCEQQDRLEQFPKITHASQLWQSDLWEHHIVSPPPHTAKTNLLARYQLERTSHVYLTDNVALATGSTEPDTVADMIQKLTHLSRTLNECAGMPAVPRRSKVQNQTGEFLEMVVEG